MNDRIIHYGPDECNRLGSLRNAGYEVENCTSLSELRWGLYLGLRPALVVFSEMPGGVPHRALSMARARRTPLVLFQGWSPHYDESEFNLVVPVLTPPELWLGDIACLVERTRNLIPYSSVRFPDKTPPRQTPTSDNEKAVIEFCSPARRRSEAVIEFAQTGPKRSEFVPPARVHGFLSLLGEEAKQELHSLLKFSTHPRGTVLFTEGQAAKEVSFVLTGQVKLSVNSSEGRRFITHIANPGETLGLASAFTSSPNEVTGETCYSCALASVSYADFLEFLQKYPHAFRIAAAELGRAYDRACVRLRTMGISSTIMTKMAGLLLEWSVAGNMTARGRQIHMALTHMEIGQCIGTTRESVTRVLHDLQRRRIIDQRGSFLTITNQEALEGYAAMH